MNKISAGALGGAISVVLMWSLEAVFSISIPAEVASAAGTICTIFASLAIPDDKEAP